VGKLIKGRKRHVVTDTIGLLVGLAVHGADVQDRPSQRCGHRPAGQWMEAPGLLKSIAIAYRLPRHIFAPSR